MCSCSRSPQLDVAGEPMAVEPVEIPPSESRAVRSVHAALSATERQSCDCVGELTRYVAELAEALRALTARAPLQAEKLLTPEEAAEVLKNSARTLRARAAAQSFPITDWGNITDLVGMI